MRIKTLAISGLIAPTIIFSSFSPVTWVRGLVNSMDSSKIPVTELYGLQTKIILPVATSTAAASSTPANNILAAIASSTSNLISNNSNATSSELNAEIAQLKSENASMANTISSLKNQVAALTSDNASCEISLAKAQKANNLTARQLTQVQQLEFAIDGFINNNYRPIIDQYGDITAQKTLDITPFITGTTSVEFINDIKQHDDMLNTDLYDKAEAFINAAPANQQQAFQNFVDYFSSVRKFY